LVHVGIARVPVHSYGNIKYQNLQMPVSLNQRHPSEHMHACAFMCVYITG